MKKMTVKLTLDIILVLLFLAMYNKMAINLNFHEIAGLVLGLFLLHKSFNLKWIMIISKKIFTKLVPGKTKFGYFINVLLFICFIFIILSGILLSKTILTFISSNNAFWKLGHFFAAALAIVLCGIHIGLHWSVLKGTLFFNSKITVLFVLLCLQLICLYPFKVFFC